MCPVRYTSTDLGLRLDLSVRSSVLSSVVCLFVLYVDYFRCLSPFLVPLLVWILVFPPLDLLTSTPPSPSFQPPPSEKEDCEGVCTLGQACSPSPTIVLALPCLTSLRPPEREATFSNFPQWFTSVPRSHVSFR